MITDSLYTTAQTVTVGKQDDQHDVLKTGTLNSSSGGETINDFGSYWLGYIAYTNVPMRCHPSIAYFDEDQTLHFEDVIDESNFPCGYCDDNYGNNSEGYNDVLMQRTVDGVTVTTTTNQIRLLNDNYPEYSGLNYNGGLFDDADGSLQFMYAKYNMGDEYQSGYTLSGVSYTFSNVTPTSNRVKKMYDVLFNDEEISLTIENEIVKCKLSDFENGTPESLYTSESGNYKFRLFLIFCYFPHGCGLNISTRVNVAGTYMVKTTGYGGAIEIVRSLRGLNSEAIRGNNLEGYTQANPYKIVWGCNGVIPLTTRQTIENYPSSGGVPFGWDGNVFVGRRSSGTSELEYRTLLFAEDVRRVFSLHYRVDTSSGFTTSYVNGVTYATDVNKNTNEFYARLKTGDISDNAFKNTLAPWQYTNFATNDFDEEEIPPYTPPSPSDRPEPEDRPEGENTGSIDFPESLGVGATLGFITQYCMNAAQITELGRTLWATFFEQDFWKNVLFSLTTAGTFNVSEILNYVISLRVYPFPLVNVPSWTAVGQDMYIGTGFLPLHFTTNLHAINSYAEYIDAGKVKIPFYFGDFRDCKNIEITLYLPYCGTVQLEPADVMGGTLHCKYAVDFATGACTAAVKLETWDGAYYPIATLPGQIGADVPMSGTAAGAVAARLGSDVINIAGILTAGAAGMSEGASLIGAGENGAGIATAGAALAGTTVAGAQKALEMMARPGIGAPALSGGRGFSAFGCPQKCYVQIRYPYYDKPNNYDATAANPASKQINVANCSGLCKFINPDVSSITASEEEKNMIKNILQAGIII